MAGIEDADDKDAEPRAGLRKPPTLIQQDAREDGRTLCQRAHHGQRHRPVYHEGGLYIFPWRFRLHLQTLDTSVVTAF